MRRIFMLCMCCVQIFAQFQYPQVVLQPLKPKGLRISLHELEPTMIEFLTELTIKHIGEPGNINKDKEQYYFANLTNSQGHWSHETKDVALNPGDTIEFTYKFINDSRRRTSDYTHKFLVEDLFDENTPAQLPLCGYTPTVVPGVKVCGGQLIFEDNFDSLREDLWKLEQYISDEDFAFVSYQRPPKAPTVSVANGLLRIEPKLQQTLPSYNSEAITTGTLDLTDGCTAPYTKCRRAASGVDILPPIASGRKTTKFAFTYGIIEIKAKLPLGDWLYPDILLQSVYEKYGSMNYASGVVRIVGALGNADLKRGLRHLGNKVLYGGPMLNMECRKSLLDLKSRVTGDPWGQEFHVYAIRWSPEQIALFVDGKEWGRTTPGSLGFQKLVPKHCHLPPTMSATGARIAPFDELFSITLGVAAGGNLEFEDNTTNNGEEKPWRNSERKSSLYFWQDVLSWWPRWTQPAMIVDYVRVYAL